MWSKGKTREGVYLRRVKRLRRMKRWNRKGCVDREETIQENRAWDRRKAKVKLKAEGERVDKDGEKSEQKREGKREKGIDGRDNESEKRTAEEEKSYK